MSEELFVAVHAGNIEVAEQLTTTSENWDSRDNDDLTVLWFALMYKHIAMAKLLRERGALLPWLDFSDDANAEKMTQAVFGYLVHGNDAFLPLILEKRNIHAQPPYAIAFLLLKWGKINVYKKFVTIKRHDFSKLPFSQTQNPFAAPTYTQDQNRLFFRNQCERYYVQSYNPWTFLNPPFNKNYILNAFSNGFAVLGDIPLCVSLLKTLDNQIKELQPCLGLEFEKITPSEVIEAGYLFMPGEKPRNHRHQSKQSILSLLLLQIEQRHGINLPRKGEPDSYPVKMFSGFVDSDKANNLVKNGYTFTEDTVRGNACMHGKYTHRLQWCILMLAKEQGLLNTCGYSIKELLQASVSDQFKNNGRTLWTRFIDRVHHLPTHGRFGLFSAQAANSFLLLTSELPHLRGYLLDNYWRSIRKIQSQISFAHDYETLAVVQALSYSNFDMSEWITPTLYEQSAHHIKYKNGIVTKRNKKLPHPNRKPNYFKIQTTAPSGFWATINNVLRTRRTPLIAAAATTGVFLIV